MQINPTKIIKVYTSQSTISRMLITH